MHWTFFITSFRSKENSGLEGVSASSLAEIMKPIQLCPLHATVLYLQIPT
jgi:hypothetical protein